MPSESQRSFFECDEQSSAEGVPPSQASHWPCGSAMARRTLNPALIESHALQIVARAMSSGRLVAFAGAGLTMAYGRMTWGQLLESLYATRSTSPSKVDSSAFVQDKRQAFWSHLDSLIWPKGALDFHLNKHNYTITAQLFEEFWFAQPADEDSSSPTTNALAMRSTVAKDLSSHVPRLQQVVRAVSADKQFEVESEGPNEPWNRVPRKARKARGPLKPYLECISPLRDGMLTVPDKSATAIVREYRSALTGFGPDESSPLSLLINSLNIRRFLTTNYDSEIENALEAFDYPQSRTDHNGRALPAHYGTRQFSKSLGPDTTAAAIRLAADGRRRHASVLHLHGLASDPHSLIVTEADYQRLYVEKHATHDLVQNAINISFAASPLLFVGSNVHEDDILRPLRQFVTGAAHQRDRQAVALLPATERKDKCVAMKLELYLRYAVHAVHYGYHHASDNSVWDWLRIASNILDEVEKVAHHIELSNKIKGCPKITTAKATAGTVILIMKETLHSETLRIRPPTRAVELPKPDCPEGIDLPISMREAASALYQGLWQALRCAELAATDKIDATSRSKIGAHLRIFSQELRSALTSYFFCAKLLQIRRDSLTHTRNEARIPLPISRSFEDFDRIPGSQSTSNSSRNRLIYFRHRVNIPSRQTEESAPECLSDFTNYIKANERFVKITGRRTIVVSSRRGSGKGALFDALGCENAVFKLIRSLGGYNCSEAPQGDGSQWPLVLHFNLSFSDDVTALTAQVTTLICHVYGSKSSVGSHDLLEGLSQALDALKSAHSTSDPSAPFRRCLLLLGNAGVLFNEHGKPKSGHVDRLLRLLSARRYAAVPMDIVMFCDELHIPHNFRESDGRRTNVDHLVASIKFAAAELGLSARSDAAKSTPAASISPSATNSCFDAIGSLADNEPQDSDTNQAERLLEWRPRLRRLRRINVHAPTNNDESTLVYPLRAFSPIEVLLDLRDVDVSATLDPLLLGPAYTPSAAKISDAVLGNGLYEIAWTHLRSSRLATTVALAFALTAPRSQLGIDASDRDLEFVLQSLQDVVPAATVERVIESVLDGWFQRHLRGYKLDSLGRTRFRRMPPPSTPALWSHLSESSWRLASEILWHLSLFSHPVESRVLFQCEAIHTELAHVISAEGYVGDMPPLQCKTLLDEVLDRMVEWCLVYCIDPRIQENASDAQPRPQRYTVHVQIQKHFLRQAGGRNVESISWDQFTTTLYASQPDEAPVLSPETHAKLVRLVKGLSAFPCPDLLFDAKLPQSSLSDFETRIDCLRAAYFLVRSTLSLGVIAHSSEKRISMTSERRAMEEYALLVRWIALEAVNLGQQDSSDFVQFSDALGESNRGRCAFFAGELVWLFNECGVIRLAQGKLDDAERSLALAECAANNIEPDDAGSMHVRVRLQAALVQIERGRSSRARSILHPISLRATGHRVPRLLATYYLGLIDSLSGNYGSAASQFKVAEKGLRDLGRSRALAMVLMHQAELFGALQPDDLEASLGRAHEAIALAQQGGHEDVRVMATLIAARLRIESGKGSTEGIFETLRYAEAYADRLEMPRISSEVFELRAQMLFRQGETHMSAAQASESLEIAALYDLKLLKARALLTLANIYAARGDVDGTRELLEFGREVATAADYYACVRGFHDLELRVPARAVASELRSRARVT